MAKSKHSKQKKSCNVVEFANAKIAFIGAGKIAEAIISGLIKYGQVEGSKIMVCAPSNNNIERLKTSYPGLKSSKRNIDAFEKFDCDIAIIAVNGSVIRNLYKLGGSRPAALTTNFIPISKHPLYICSLVPGFTMANLREVLLNPEYPQKYLVEMHRVVLNCAVAHGLGITAIDVEPDSKKLSQPVRAMLTCISKSIEYIPEPQMDAAQAIIGPSLAFCYSFINDIALGGVKIGLNRQTAIKYAAKASTCAASTLLETGKHPNDLRDEVCAPSGAGIYATAVLDKSDISSAVSGAVEAAYKRAQSFAKEDDQGSKTNRSKVR